MTQNTTAPRPPMTSAEYNARRAAAMDDYDLLVELTTSLIPMVVIQFALGRQLSKAIATLPPTYQHAARAARLAYSVHRARKNLRPIADEWRRRRLDGTDFGKVVRDHFAEKEQEKEYDIQAPNLSEWVNLIKQAERNGEARK